MIVLPIITFLYLIIFLLDSKVFIKEFQSIRYDLWPVNLQFTYLLFSDRYYIKEA